MVRISKTYTPKEKEKYMCAKHLAYFKMKLMEWKKDLKRSNNCLLYTSPSPRDGIGSRIPSSA